MCENCGECDNFKPDEFGVMGECNISGAPVCCDDDACNMSENENKQEVKG